MGWRDISDDAQRVVFWLGLASAAVGGIVTGAWLGWWAWFYEGLPLTVVITEALAAFCVVSVSLVALQVVSHNYFGWPKSHPLRVMESLSTATATALPLFEWREPDGSDARPGYQYWVHAVFRIDAPTHQRGRAFLDVDNGMSVDRTNAHIAGQNWHGHEIHHIKPGEQYRVPVFMRLDRSIKLWIDERQGKRGVLGRIDPGPVDAGCYLTDSAFLDQLHRAPLSKGVYRVRAVLVFGDNDEHSTEWRQFKV